MRADGPAPSITSLVTSWLSLTGLVFSSVLHRANSLAENSADAVMDVGCPPAEQPGEAGDLPVVDPEQFALSLCERTWQTLRQVGDVINDDPHGCFEAVTRDRVHTLFRELAEYTLSAALEQRVAAAEAERGEAEAPEWVRKYRRMLAAEGRWPPGPETTESVHGEESPPQP
jgi:hypothetical protein